MNKEVKGVLLALAAALVSGFSIPLNKIFVVNLDTFVFTSIRLLVIGTVFFALTRFKKIRIRKKENVKYLVILAIVGGAMAFLLFFTGLKLTTAGRGAFLQKTLPLYVVVLAFMFLKEKVSRRQLSSLVLMFLGTVAIYFSDIVPSASWLNPSFGDLLVIFATVLWASENVIAKKVMNNGEDNLIVSSIRMLLGGAILFASIIILGNFNAILNLGAGQVMNIGISTMLLFGYTLFWYWSLKFIDVSKAACFLLVSPVISLLIGLFFLNEPVTYFQLIGSALILMGAYFASHVKNEYVMS